jgi:hypothetical protein
MDNSLGNLSQQLEEEREAHMKTRDTMFRYMDNASLMTSQSQNQKKAIEDLIAENA